MFDEFRRPGERSFAGSLAESPKLRELCDDLIVNGKHWELTSYEWNPRTGVARFGYQHKHTGIHIDCIRQQSTYVRPVEARTQQRVHRDERRGLLRREVRRVG